MRAEFGPQIIITAKVAKGRNKCILLLSDPRLSLERPAFWENIPLVQVLMSFTQFPLSPFSGKIPIEAGLPEEGLVKTE